MKHEEKDIIPEDYFDEVSGVIVNPTLADKVNGTNDT